MKKTDLVDIVAGITSGTKVQAEEIVSAIFDALAQSMARGEDADVAGFGKFQGKDRAARTARNPRTGEAVPVPAMRVPKFKAAKALKDTVKG